MRKWKTEEYLDGKWGLANSQLFGVYCPHLISGQAEVVGQDLPVAEPAWEVVYDVLIVQLIVFIQVLLKAFHL